MRRSVLTRLTVVSLAVTLCAILATAWLAALTVSSDKPAESSRSLAEENRVYRDLTAYAATHTSWTLVEPLLKKLERETGRTIVLYAQGSAYVSNYVEDADQRAKEPLAIINPLDVDPTLDPSALSTGISALVGGAFVLSADEKKSLEAMAVSVTTCVTEKGGVATTSHRANGRPVVKTTPPDLGNACGTLGLDTAVTETEYVELQELDRLTNACLRERGSSSVTLSRDLEQPLGFAATRDNSSNMSDAGAPTSAEAERIASCLISSRKDELSGWVSPSAELYIFDPKLPTPAPFSLSARNLVRIAAVSGGVLAVAILATVVVGIRLMRPIRHLTEAAERMTNGASTVRVPVRGDDEIARLSRSFNTMSAERERTETQRAALTSDIAHELRTPLTNIRGWIEARQDGLVDDDEKFTSSLLEDALQLARIVDDLQDLTQADAGTLALRKERVAVSELLSGITASHSPRALDKQITLDTNIKATEFWVDADAVRLRQIMDNIVANALNHTPRGGAVILTAEVLDGCAVMTITDTGSGIASADLNHIFDRFWRTDPSRSRNTGGSGLGLAIVRKLVTAHEGTVTVTSEVGVGSTFTVTLPRAHESATPQ